MNLTNRMESLGVKISEYQGSDLEVYSPVDGQKLTALKVNSESEVNSAVELSQEAFKVWREIPRPRRGRLIGIFGEVLREKKSELAELVTLECGKINSESLGEVQEMIDVCELAVGLSRQMEGKVMHSELPGHILYENWHPKGVVGIITAFNFPVAVWAWNIAISAVCGNTHIWKPSEKTPLTALACQALFEKAISLFEKESKLQIPSNISQVILGKADVGLALVSNINVPLISATGSCRMGSAVQAEVAKTLGRNTLQELGGNNAVIITPSANLKLAIESTLFGAMGTAGQRCTTTRRLFIQENIFDKVYSLLKEAYQQISQQAIGDPRNPDTLVGPLIDQNAFDQMQESLQKITDEGGEITGGERVEIEACNEAFYVAPALVKLAQQTPTVLEETFAPVLYVIPYKNLDEAIVLNNSVEQGLSSAIFTNNITEQEQFLRDADTGIANVNNGTSGAELGGAFGGNKATGGGREAGSDAWKAYMNRSTNRTNYQTGKMQLAQGVEFPVKLDFSSLD